MRKTAIERFNEKVRISVTGCHEWIGRLNPKGYGQFHPDKSWQAHRWIFHYHNPETPISLYILHKCDNRRCVNPDHLYAGTQQDNMDDMYQRGRNIHVRGEESARTYFTEKQVSNIKGLSLIGLQSNLLAKVFKSEPTTIWSIIKGKSWNHVPFPKIIGNKSHNKRRVSRVTKASVPVNMLSLEGEFIRRFKSATHAACFLNRCATGFREVVNGRQPTWGGFKWQYSDPERNAKYSKK